MNLSAILVQALPERLTAEMREGSGITVLNWHLKSIADSIDVVLHNFSCLERSLGLPDDHDGRYSPVVKSARAVEPRQETLP